MAPKYYYSTDLDVPVETVHSQQEVTIPKIINGRYQAQRFKWVTIDTAPYWQPWDALGEPREDAETALHDIDASGEEDDQDHYMDAIVIVGRP